jgi:hypothetical protein
VSGYTTARGTVVVAYVRYRAGLADFANEVFGRAGSVTMTVRWAGKAFLALDAGLSAVSNWQATAGHSDAYRFTYTLVRTAVVVTSAAGGAVLGAQAGMALGCPILPPYGCIVGGAAGAIAGGLGGREVGETAFDWVWDFSYEAITGGDDPT